MANVEKMKRRNNLGVPPSLEEASQNLHAPEIVPVVTPPAARPRRAPVTRHQPARAVQDETLPPMDARHRIDGRSLRRTHRTLQFATRVSWDFDDKLRRIAQRDGLKLVEVLERALEAYEETRS